MGRRSAILCSLMLTLAAATGCKMPQNARYIYQDGEYGVIGIPQNSPYGKRDYRKQAERLMSEHFPDGYEIVRSEEVVEGQRVLDKSRKSEFATEPTIDALSQKITLGKLASSSLTQEKDSLPILESRIIYKRRTHDEPPGANGFAASSKQVPELYLDPNDMARCREKLELADLKNHKGKPTALAEKSADSDVKKASDADAKKASDTDVKKAAFDALK